MSVFEMTKAEMWINEMRRELAVDDEQRAWLALRAGLHALRDRLTVQQNAHLAAQLPLAIRGLFYEGWQGSRRRQPRSVASFLEAIERALPPGKLKAEAIARAMFNVLDRHVTPGQLDNVRHELPHQIAELWRPSAAPLEARGATIIDLG